MKQKKGQFERSFSMIITLIVIGMIIIIGFKGINSFIKFQKEQEYKTFETNFNNLIDEYTEYGSYKKIRIVLPGKDKVLCIFDTSLEEVERIFSSEESFEGKSFLEEYWKVLGEKDNNIILYPSKKTFKNNKIYFGEKILGDTFNKNYKGYFCIKKKSTNIILEGTGSKVKLTVEENNE